MDEMRKKIKIGHFIPIQNAAVLVFEEAKIRVFLLGSSDPIALRPVWFVDPRSCWPLTWRNPSCLFCMLDHQPLDPCTWTAVNRSDLLTRSGPCDQLTRSSQPSNLFYLWFSVFFNTKKFRKNFGKISINPVPIQTGILWFYFIYSHIYILLYIILFVKFYYYIII